MMSQSSYKRRKVSFSRDFPLGCNTQSTTVKGSDDVALISETKENFKRRKVSSIRDFPLGSNTHSTVKGSDDVAVIISETKENFKQRKVSSVREFPLGFKTRSTSVKNEIGSDDVAVKSENLNGYEDSKCVHRNHHRREEVESFDSIMKKAGFNVAANGNVGDGKFPPAKRKFTPFCGSKVKPLSSEEGIQLMSSERERRRFLCRKPLLVKAVQKHRNSPRNSPAKKKLSNAAALRLRANAHRPSQHRDEGLSPRDKVNEALRLFRFLFKELDGDKAAGRVTTSKSALTRTEYKARDAVIKRGMLVNCEKMIGPVPGIKIGDGFQFKVELNIIGLHFGIRGGIDYMKKGNMELATSIVSAEGNGYIDRCDSDVLIYCGQGGHKDQKVVEDQKLVAGNMALVNSMRKMTPVRVILGKRWDQRGKNYVYDGLYMVQDYWREKGPHGYMVFMFELRRVPGQPYPYVEF